MKRFKKIWVHFEQAEIGREVEFGNYIYEVKIALKERCVCNFGGGYVEKLVLMEYVCTVRERLQNDILILSERVKKLEDKEKNNG